MVIMQLGCYSHCSGVFNITSSRSSLLWKRRFENIKNFSGGHLCWSVVSMMLLCNFIEIALWHRFSAVNFLHAFRTLFYRNSYGGLLLLKWATPFVILSLFLRVHKWRFENQAVHFDSCKNNTLKVFHS